MTCWLWRSVGLTRGRLSLADELRRKSTTTFGLRQTDGVAGYFSRCARLTRGGELKRERKKATRPLCVVRTTQEAQTHASQSHVHFGPFEEVKRTHADRHERTSPRLPAKGFFRSQTLSTLSGGRGAELRSGRDGEGKQKTASRKRRFKRCPPCN